MTRLSTEPIIKAIAPQDPVPSALTCRFHHLCCGLFSPRIKPGEMLETLKTIRIPRRYRNHNMARTERYKTYDPGRLRFPVPEDLQGI